MTYVRVQTLSNGTGVICLSLGGPVYKTHLFRLISLGRHVQVAGSRRHNLLREWKPAVEMCLWGDTTGDCLGSSDYVSVCLANSFLVQR